MSPYQLPKEIISYFYKIFELGEMSNFRDRVHFIWPENYERMPSTFATCKVLYYSNLAMNRIKELIAHKIAYIVPGSASQELNLLAHYLQVPIF